MSLLEITDVQWSPAGESPVLRGVTLAVDSGESVAILGQSGSGKSTILRCIVGFERLDEGAIRFDGEEITAENILDVRRAIAFVAQQPAPVAETVSDILAFARDIAGVGAEEQQQMMGRLGLQEIPGDREFERLSVGEQQRLCFVRALTLQPTMLLLDEPTSALDSANVEMLESLVDEWLDEDHRRAAVWVTHDDAQAERVATRLVRLREGRIE